MDPDLRPPTLTRAQASAALPQWRLLLGRMHLSVDTDDFATALDFVGRVAELADAANHHPDVRLHWGRVDLALVSHDAGGLTDRDISLGLAIDEVVADLGLSRRPDRLVEVEIAIDVMDVEAVRPFWAAALGWPIDPVGGSIDHPTRGGPSVWFQQMAVPRQQRNRIHIDITVAHDEAEGRVLRALAAGGRLVSDSQAPRFWVLADPEGNEACICTWQGRD